MIKAVLLDLDDTLLGNSTERFIQAYLGLLAQSLGATFPAEVMQGVMVATREVARKQDALRTNEEAFFEAMQPFLPQGRAAFDVPVAEFYRTIFPGLRSHTQERPFVRGMVDWLIGEGYRVVVATNPFFPRVAIEQRLAWAGLPVDVIPFALVTTLENSHFCKPHPEYYEEITARLGVRNDEAIMIGDDWNNDIIPAWQAGLNTFWVPSDGVDPAPVPPVEPDGIGTMEVFASLVQRDGWLRSLSPRPLTAAQIVPRLRGNLAAILGVVRTVPSHDWTMRPAPEELSPLEVVCALQATERDVHRPRLAALFHAEDSVDSRPDTLPDAAADCVPDGWAVALAFAAERQKTLEFLTSLPAAAWTRPVPITDGAPVTLLDAANAISHHDRERLTQLSRIVSRSL